VARIAEGSGKGRKRRRKTPPPVYERPAPADRDSTRPSPTSGGSYTLPRPQPPPPVYRDEVMQAKMAAAAARRKRLVRPADSAVIAKQSALRNAGFPVTVDGHNGPRTRFNWAAQQDVTAGLRDEVANQPKGMWRDPMWLTRLEQLKHDPVNRGFARPLAVAAGLPGADKGSLEAAIAKGATASQLELNRLRIRNNIEAARPGTFTSGGRFVHGMWMGGGPFSLDRRGLMQARMAARGVTPAGLGSLSGDELLWIWNADGVSMRRQFTTAVKTPDGVKSLPGEELTRGMQGYAKAQGEDVKVNGVLDTHTVDAFLRAARREQDRREKAVVREARDFYFQGDAYNTAARAVGYPLSFEEAWKLAGSGGTDKRSILATQVMIAASELAKGHLADELWRRERVHAYDQALYNLSGTAGYTYFDAASGTTKMVRADQQVGLGGIDPTLPKSKAGTEYQSSPWQGTPFGISPGREAQDISGLREQASADPLRTPPWMAEAMGVPELYARNETLADAVTYQRMAQQQAMELQAKMDGTKAGHHLVMETTKLQIPQRNADGSIKMRAVAGPVGGVTRVPVYTTIEVDRPETARIVRDDPFRRIVSWTAGVLGHIPDTQELGFANTVGPAVGMWRNSELLASRLDGGGIVSNEIYTGHWKTGMGPLEGPYVNWNQSVQIGRDIYQMSPVILQFTAYVVFDPLNYLGPVTRGAGIFARGLRAFYRVTEVEDGLLGTTRQVLKSVDDTVLGAASKISEGASAVGRHFAELTPAPIRGQFALMKEARDQHAVMLDEARSLGYRGSRVDQATLQRLRRSEQVQLEGLLSHRQIGQIIRILEHFGVDVYLDKGMTRLSQSGEHIMRLLMAVSEPGQLKKLRDLNPDAFLKGDINDETLALALAGGSFGSRGSYLSASIRKTQAQVRAANERHVLQVLSRHLRRVGDYQFVDHPSWTRPGGYRVPYYPGAENPELELLQRPEFDQAYEQIRGPVTELENRGFAQQMSAADRNATIQHIAGQEADRRMAGYYAAARENGELVDQARAREQRDAYVKHEVQQLEELMPPMTAFDEADVAELQRLADQQVVRKRRQLEESETSLREMRRAKRNLLRDQAQVVLTMLQGSPHLRGAAVRFAPRGGLDKAAVEEAGVGALSQGEADVQAIARVRRALHTYLGGTFDVSSLKGVQGLGDRLQGLQGVFKQTSVLVGRRLKDLGIEPEFDARIWERDAEARLAEYGDSTLPQDVRIERKVAPTQMNPAPTSGRMARDVPGGGYYRPESKVLGRPAEISAPPVKSIGTLATAFHELGHGLLQGVKRWRGLEATPFKETVWSEVLAWVMARRMFVEQFGEHVTPELLEKFDQHALGAFLTYAVAPRGRSSSPARRLLPREFDEIAADARAIAPEMSEFIDRARQVYDDAGVLHRGQVKEHFLAQEDVLAGEQAAADLIPQSEIDWYEDIMGTSDVLQEKLFRRVLARMMIGDFQRAGLFGDTGDLKDLERQLERSSRSTELRDLVSRMPWKHSTVMAQQGQLDRLIGRRNDLLDQLHMVERQPGQAERVRSLRAQIEDVTDAELRASDKLYSSLLALRSRTAMEGIVDRAQAEYAYLISLPNPTDAQRAVALARRIQIRKIGGYLEDTRLQAERAETGVASRAMDVQKRAIGDAEFEIRRQERLVADHRRQLQSFENRPKVQAGVRGFIDLRPTVMGRFNPEMGSLSARLGVVGSHHDVLHYALQDPAMRAMGRVADRAGVLIQARKARAHLLRPESYMEHLYVYADDFADEGFTGEVHGEHGVSPEGKFEPHEGPDPSRGKTIGLNELSQDQLFQMLASEHIQPSRYLRHRVARQYARDRAQPWSAVTRGASGLVTAKERGPIPPDLADAVKELFDRHVMSHRDLSQFDWGQIDQLARENPRYAEGIQQMAVDVRVREARIDYEDAARNADKQLAPQLLRQQGRFARAWMMSNNRGARWLWNRWDAIMSTWRFWVMAGNPAYHAMNHIGDLGRALLIGALGPQDLIVEHAGLAENLLYLMVKAPPQMLYALAGHFDNQFATGMQRAMRDLLRWFEHLHFSVQEALYGAQDVPYPEELMAMAESRTSSWLEPLGDDDPFDVRRMLDEYRESKRDVPRGYRRSAEGGIEEVTWRTAEFSIGDVRLLQKALGRQMWHMLGDAPETWRRRAVFRSSYRRRLWEIGLEHPDMPVENAQAAASEYALGMVNRAMFDYNEVPVLLENLRLIVPFPSFTYKMAALTPHLAAKHPWLFPAVWRVENTKDPVTGEVDPLAGYVDVTWVTDPLFEALGLDHYAAKGVGFNVTQLLDFRRTYKAFMGMPNPHLAPEAGGKEFVNSVTGFMDMTGLGLNPWIRSGLQAADLMHSEAWRTIFPQTSMGEAITRQWWDERYPNGLNLERFALDPVYREFHEGKSLTELREDDLVYYTAVEVGRQVAEGLPPDYAKARHDVEGFLAFAAVFQLISGLWVRRLNPADHELIRIGELARTDSEGLSPHQAAVNAIYRLRGAGEEAMKRGIDAYPYIEAYYRLTGWDQKNALLADHPEVAAYVQWARLRKEFRPGTAEAEQRSRRDRDRILSTQAAAVGRMYGYWKDGGWDSTVRERFYQSMMTPELRDYFARHATPQGIADKFVLAEFHGYMHRVSQAFHDLPEKDYKARGAFMDRNPWLSEYWQLTGRERKDAEHLMSGIDASYRAWYFAVADSEGFDAAAPILEAHPYMFDNTSASGRVDRYLGQWVPKDAASIAEHAADYRRMKGVLDAYFQLPKGQARLDFTSRHPALAAYFRKYGAHRHFSRRFRRFGHFRRFRFAAASNPFLAKRVDFWHQFFSLKPDKRLAFIKKHAGDAHIFAWGPTADSIFTSQAHGFSFGNSARLDAYHQIAPLLTLYFELKPEDRAFFLQVNPEVQMYFDQFSTHSPTGDPKLDKALEKFFDAEGEDRDAILQANPGLKAFFDSKRTTPEEKALGVLLDAYFGLPKGYQRKMYLLTHPEVQGFFDKRKDERDLEDAWLGGLVDADPRLLAFQKTEAYQLALDDVRLHRAALIAGRVEGRHRTRLDTAGRRRHQPSVVRDVREPTS
jgi:hypothetical protein